VHNGDIQAILRKVQPAVVRIDVNGPTVRAPHRVHRPERRVIVTNAHVAPTRSRSSDLADASTATASDRIDAAHDSPL